MQILDYKENYREDIFRLWNTAGAQEGYAHLTEEELDKLLLKHPYFDKDAAFVLKKDSRITGFICGTGAEDLPKGRSRGYLTCILLEGLENPGSLNGLHGRGDGRPYGGRGDDVADGAYAKEEFDLLMEALEQRFRDMGKSECMEHFFNPVKLPWVMPETGGAQHNNVPGVARDSVLYSMMRERGYETCDVECAMYMDMASYATPCRQREIASGAAEEGYSIEWYDQERHAGLQEMVDSVGNTEWSRTIKDYAEKINMLVAVKDGRVAGFAGPVYPEKSGRGFFVGIAVSADHEHRGLGSLLFFRLCEEEKKRGAAYMSLFTDADGRARRIYESVGFKVKRIFCAVKKNLET